MRFNKFHPKTPLFALIFLVLFGSLFLFSQSSRTQLDAIQQNGVLRLATRNTPTTYYIDNNGNPAGFEYELAQAFASYLGVELELIIPPTFAEIFPLLKNRTAHIAAAGLTVTKERKKKFRFSPPYAYTTPTVIYRVIQGRKAPKEVADLLDKDIRILSNSSHAELMRSLKKTTPSLQWQERDNATATELLAGVYNKEFDYTISDDLIFDAQKSFFPGLKKSLILSEPEPVAWMLIKQKDQSLQRALKHFFERIETQELLVQLKQKYLTRQNHYSYVDIRTFKQDMKSRFCKLEQYFYMAEQETDIDWLLLAAIAYQESHWNPKAVSPTGVKGIMMLTKATAKEVNIEDRTDPMQSILGGAHYLLKVTAKIPDRIQGDDRTWFALASYNVGYGHLEDARILTARAGKNPDSWDDVKEFLPLLTQEKYFQTLKRGYARGYEPVLYVKNIRKYYDLLIWEMKLAQMEANRAAHSPAENEGEIVMPGGKNIDPKPSDLIDNIPSAL
ncbi:MAG: membrane-bound lytic murein transglycosylase MltF [Amphritea sp.]